MSDKISVIIRSRNEDRWIGHAIQSVLDFIYKPEIIKLTVYEIIFNKENQAIKINTYDQENLNEISFNLDVTKTRGNEKPLLQYILKGIGNSNIQK